MLVNSCLAKMYIKEPKVKLCLNTIDVDPLTSEVHEKTD